jgi:hypothetical protein
MAIVDFPVFARSGPWGSSTAERGWVCPNCHRGCAPWVPYCCREAATVTTNSTTIDAQRARPEEGSDPTPRP